MDRQFFNRQMERLTKVYGTAKYPIERQDVVFMRMRIIENVDFEKQITNFIANNERAPMLNDFEEAFRAILLDLRSREKEELESRIQPCFICGNTGHLTMYDKSNGCEYSFQCNCPRGPLLYPSFPKLYQGMESRFASHRAYVAGKFDRAAATKINFEKNKPIKNSGSDTPKHIGEILGNGLKFFEGEK